MPTQDEFIEQIADAYEHLYDLVYLRTHPLVDLLVADATLDRHDRAWRLHHLLLDGIELLDPGPQVPPHAREWRRYRLMVLRFEEGLTSSEVAEQLAISRRHYYREHAAAIEAVAGVLWDRYQAAQAESVAQEAEASEALGRVELLRLEAARAAQMDRYAHIGDVVEGVRDLLQGLLQQREVEMEIALPASLSPLAIDPGMLRQMLLSIAGYLVERARQATLRITAAEAPPGVRLSAMIDPRTALSPGNTEALDERLNGLAEMARPSGTQVEPRATAQGLVLGFDLLIQTLERTLLVVDDNREVLELFRRYLIPHGYRVVTAQSVEEALITLQTLTPYAVILDLMMPERDGWDLLQSLLGRPETADIPLLVCTVLKQKDLALALGATGFVPKPITEEKLLAALAKLEQT